jgi:hypothetical protein
MAAVHSALALSWPLCKASSNAGRGANRSKKLNARASISAPTRVPTSTGSIAGPNSHQTGRSCSRVGRPSVSMLSSRYWIGHWYDSGRSRAGWELTNGSRVGKKTATLTVNDPSVFVLWSLP